MAEFECAIVMLNAIILWSIMHVLQVALRTLIMCNGNHDIIKIRTNREMFTVALISFRKSVRGLEVSDIWSLHVDDDGGVDSDASFFNCKQKLSLWILNWTSCSHL